MPPRFFQRDHELCADLKAGVSPARKHFKNENCSVQTGSVEDMKMAWISIDHEFKTLMFWKMDSILARTVCKVVAFLDLRSCAHMSSSDSLGSQKHKLEIDGLFREWEGQRPIRDHLNQNGAVLFKEKVTESVKTTCVDHIYAVLEPLIWQMSRTPGAPQPAIEPLREQISDLYKRLSKQVPETQIIHDSWCIRKFLGFVKMKCRIQKPSTVFWLHIMKFKLSFQQCIMNMYTSLHFDQPHGSKSIMQKHISYTVKYKATNLKKVITWAAIQVEKFQKLCLLLDSTLQDGQQNLKLSSLYIYVWHINWEDWKTHPFIDVGDI